MAKRKHDPHKDQNRAEDRQIQAIEDLREFEDFQRNLLPKFREILLEAAHGKKTPQEVFELAKAAAAAKQVSIAFFEKNSAVALKAIEKIIDRTEGPVTQKHEVSTYDKATDDQLRAILSTKLNRQADEDDPESSRH